MAGRKERLMTVGDSDVKRAIGYMILSAFGFTFMNVFVKYLVHFNAYELVFFRSLGSLFFTMGFLWQQRISILGNQRKLLVLRGLAGVTSMTLFFMSLKYLPVGTSVSVRYIAPIFAALFAVVLLKERIKGWQWIFFLMSFIGVIVLKGFDGQVSFVGLSLALGAAVASGLVFIIINRIGQGDHPVVIVNYFMLIATLVGGVLAIPNWIMPEGWEWLLLLSLGIFGFFGQLYMTKAFQGAKTNIVAPFKYTEVLFTGVIGFFWFDEMYGLWSLLGISLIVGGMVLNVWYKTRLMASKSE
ncbi:DMT family transporter [Sediminicola sp. 1XM1-17]|uniref:DMT family transporter n=1 Tax=Sediminicola sp. 1XM1-17 TaxID=3127702 RepID=UPI003076F5CA